MIPFLELDPGHKVQLPASGGFPAAVHVFDADSLLAINAALGAGRPLLVRGEPGLGKSQMARAAAAVLKRALVARTIDARTEPHDLLYSLDLVARLARAQVLGAVRHAAPDPERVAEELAERHFLSPGPLWWGFAWDRACDQAREVGMCTPEVPEGWTQEDGVVVLIDEIDKADPSVPNALLDALGHGSFEVPGRAGRISLQRTGPPPLVVATTNEERSLPDPFLRRCLVLQLELDDSNLEAFVAFLVARGQAHARAKLFSHAPSDELLDQAARILWRDRKATRNRGFAPPGQAEYLDLVRAVTAQRKSSEEQLELFEKIRRFTFEKHPPPEGQP